VVRQHDIHAVQIPCFEAQIGMSTKMESVGTFIRSGVYLEQNGIVHK
jgi:hypothetical protein